MFDPEEKVKYNFINAESVLDRRAVKEGVLVLKKLNRILNIVIGSFIGVFIGHGIYVYWDYKTHLFAQHYNRSIRMCFKLSCS